MPCETFDSGRTGYPPTSDAAEFARAAAKAFDLTPSRDAAASLAGALDAFYADVGRGAIRPAAANEAIQRLARILVPINYTRVPRFRHDPATPIPPLPTIATATELKGLGKEKLGFARTQLTRGQNRLIAALREAEEVLKRAS